MNKEHIETFWNPVAKIDTVYIIYTPAKIDFDYWVFITEIVYTFTRKVQLIGVRRVWSDYFKSEKKSNIDIHEWMNKLKKATPIIMDKASRSSIQAYAGIYYLQWSSALLVET